MNIPKQRVFWAVGLGHFVNDVFMSMGPVLLAFLSVSVLPMTNTQIGLTVSAAQLLGAVSQPWFGLMADRTGGRWIGAGGVAWTVGCLMLAVVGAQTGYFWLMFIPFVSRGLGSGAFHPAGAMHAADSDSTRSASNLAYFFLLGQTGLATGPVLAGIVLDRVNVGVQSSFNSAFTPVYDIPFVWSGTALPLLFIAIIALPVVTFMALSLPASAIYRAANAEATQKKATDSGGLPAQLPVKAFAILGVMVALRSLAQPGSVTFIPVLFQDKGWSPAEYGAITSSFWIASGVMGVVFGNIADRFDRRWVVAISLALGAPAFFLLPVVDGAFAFALAILAGGLTGGSHSIIVVLAQELIPSAKGFASGAILGFIFGTGALGSFLIGTISDSIGLGATFQLVAVAVVIASVIALALPAKAGQPPATTDQLEAAAAD